MKYNYNTKCHNIQDGKKYTKFSGNLMNLFLVEIVCLIFQILIKLDFNLNSISYSIHFHFIINVLYCNLKIN